MLFKNPDRTSKRTPHFTITKINWLTLLKFNPLKTKLVQMLFKNSVRTSKRTQLVTITNINFLTLFKEIVPVYHHHHHWLDSPTWALAFLRSFYQLKYPAIASSDFVTRVFSRVGLSAPHQSLFTPRLTQTT
jgi:hypothetical protein